MTETICLSSIRYFYPAAFRNCNHKVKSGGWGVTPELPKMKVLRVNKKEKKTQQVQCIIYNPGWTFGKVSEHSICERQSNISIFKCYWEGFVRKPGCQLSVKPLFTNIEVEGEAWWSCAYSQILLLKTYIIIHHPFWSSQDCNGVIWAYTFGCCHPKLARNSTKLLSSWGCSLLSWNNLCCSDWEAS